MLWESELVEKYKNCCLFCWKIETKLVAPSLATTINWMIFPIPVCVYQLGKSHFVPPPPLWVQDGQGVSDIGRNTYANLMTPKGNKNCQPLWLFRVEPTLVSSTRDTFFFESFPGKNFLLNSSSCICVYDTKDGKKRIILELAREHFEMQAKTIFLLF